MHRRLSCASQCRRQGTAPESLVRETLRLFRLTVMETRTVR